MHIFGCAKGRLFKKRNSHTRTVVLFFKHMPSFLFLFFHGTKKNSKVIMLHNATLPGHHPTWNFAKLVRKRPSDMVQLLKVKTNKGSYFRKRKSHIWCTFPWDWGNQHFRYTIKGFFLHPSQVIWKAKKKVQKQFIYALQKKRI